MTFCNNFFECAIFKTIQFPYKESAAVNPYKIIMNTTAPEKSDNTGCLGPPLEGVRGICRYPLKFESVCGADQKKVYFLRKFKFHELRKAVNVVKIDHICAKKAL